MARRYDPRYDVNQGYAAGDAMVKLSQLLRQGVGDYRQAGLDEENSQQKQANYLLQLQQMLGAQEDRDLDRGVKMEALSLGRDTRAQQSAERAAALANKRTGQSGLAKLLKMPSEVTEETPPPPAFAGDPERLQPNILQSLVKRPRTRDEAMTGLTPDEAGHTDVFDRLMKLYPTPDKPKAAEPFTLGAGQTRFDPTGAPVANVPNVEKPEKPPKPFFEGKTPAELDIILADPSTPPEQKAIAQAALKSIRSAGIDQFRAQGAATGEAMRGREQAKYDRDPLGDEAGKWMGAGGRPVSPGLSRAEAVSQGARPLNNVQEAQALRQGAGVTRYIEQYMDVIPLYPKAGTSDAANLVNAGIGGAKIYMGRKSGGAATKIDALEGQITRLIRSFGDTGNAAVAERATTLKAVPGYMETQESAADKLRIIITEVKGAFEDMGIEPPPKYDALLQQLDSITGGSGGGDANAIRKRIQELERKAAGGK